MNNFLQFGIPSFDALFGRGRLADIPRKNDEKERRARKQESYPDYAGFGYRIFKPESEQGQEDPDLTTSLCLIGPDGTGKSVFGLHLAAQYMADLDDTTEMVANGADLQTAKQVSGLDSREGEELSSEPWGPRVLYVSTDLKHHVAEGMWKNFGLKSPNQREFPFYCGNRHGRDDEKKKKREVNLHKLDPAKIDTALLDLPFNPKETNVFFVDLVSRTMGDDWHFVNRLLALLPTPPKGSLPHLIVIDAVEGFETLVGDKDAFGETTSRRSRIAQIMRTAANKCHVCFIVEEPKAEARFPEEFVTDIVVRFRTTITRGYLRRTLEIEKARGQSHVRGQHPFVIRRGSGSTTGDQNNADDPQTSNSYIAVYPSLHVLSRDEMESRSDPTPKSEDQHVAAFGIRHLDTMLASLNCKPEPGFEGFDDHGLLTQDTAALIGEAATQTTGLATAFLARAFRGFIFRVADTVSWLSKARNNLPGHPPDSPKTGEKIAEMRSLQQEFIRNALIARMSASERITKNISLECIKEKAEYASLVNNVESVLNCLTKGSVEEAVNKLCTYLPEELKDKLLEGPELISFASWLTASLPESGAAVLITTNDQDCDRLSDEFLNWLDTSINKAIGTMGELATTESLKEDYRNQFLRATIEHIKNRTVCRRLEFHDLASPILFHIFKQAVMKAQEEVFLSGYLGKCEDRLPYSRAVRFESSWNIRVVLDDLNTLKNTYPDIGADPIFLPSLLQFLKLEGVTSLIVDSQNGRPDAVLSDVFEGNLRALVQHKLLTWRVPFFGSMRDAITVLPPYPGVDSVVRELRPSTREDKKKELFVDPEFELYSGLESGQPKPVPLEVLLYAERSTMTVYIAEVNELFGRLFTPLRSVDGKRDVVEGIESSQYSALHDLCNLRSNTQLDHTMVFQVDEFWATEEKVTSSASSSQPPLLRRERALCRLGDYLEEETSSQVGKDEQPEQAKIESDPFNEPYGVFTGPPQARTAAKDATPVEHHNLFLSSWKRKDFFSRSLPEDLIGNEAKVDSELRKNIVQQIDRSPFAWDFGFLLCSKSMWEHAGGRETGYERDGIKDTVKDVWNLIPKAQSTPRKKEYVPWRRFLGASRAVAQAHAKRSDTPVATLDVSMLATESLLCLVLEIWASEIADLTLDDRQGAFFNGLDRINWAIKEPESLIDWLDWEKYPERVLAFYKTWLLLVESLPMGNLTEDETIPRLKIREAHGNAAATRHWYKTACNNQGCPIPAELAISVRLPGHFSVRGDWYLAIAGGSRSERLGRRALDLLSTRRANFRRMELGIGLPTRDLMPDESTRHLPTALGVRDAGGQITAVSYADLTALGSNRKDSNVDEAHKFHWLWRSQLSEYHRQSRLTHSWLGQLVVQWSLPEHHPSCNWVDGFAGYDSLKDIGKELSVEQRRDAIKEKLDKVASWMMFRELCIQLREQMIIASASRGPD